MPVGGSLRLCRCGRNDGGRPLCTGEVGAPEPDRSDGDGQLDLTASHLPCLFLAFTGVEPAHGDQAQPEVADLGQQPAQRG